MQKLAVWIFALCCTVALGSTAQLPENLAFLESLSNDETAMVEAARNFISQEKELIETDKGLLVQYRESGKRELAESNIAEIGRRIETMDAAWTYVLSKFRNNAAANNYYGELLYDCRGNHARGLERWKIALAIDEDLDRAHNNLGIHYFHSGEVPRGLEHLTRALKLDPKNPDYLFNAAQMYLNFFPQLEKELGLTKQKLYKKAMAFSRDAARYGEGDYSLHKDFADNFWSGSNFGVKVNWEDAAEAWREAREYARDQSDVFHALMNEGRTWVHAERWDNALERLNEASQIRPDGPAIKTLLERAKAGAAASED